MKIMDEAMFEKENVFGLGQTNTAFAQYFVGNSYLNPLTEAGKCPVFPAKRPPTSGVKRLPMRSTTS